MQGVLFIFLWHAGKARLGRTKWYRKDPIHLLWQNRFNRLKMEVSTPPRACLTRETGESDSLFFESHQLFRERRPTPLAISSGYHFEILVLKRTPSSFLKINFGRDLLEKHAPFSDETLMNSRKSLCFFFFFFFRVEKP